MANNSNILRLFLTMKKTGRKERMSNDYNYQTKAKPLKGGYLDFSHLTELENIYLTEIYKNKKPHTHKSSITKNHKIKRKKFFDGVPLKGYVTS